MLGIFLIICLAVFLFIKLKIYNLLKDGYIESVKINSDGRTYNVCYRAVMLHAVSNLVILLGYIGCAWPFLFIERIDRIAYFADIVIFGVMPILSFAYACYSDIRNAHGYIRISTDEIECKRHRSFSVKVVNGGVKVYHLAEQKCTTRYLYSQDRPGCQDTILPFDLILSG
jgi:hypothetical protein